MDAELKALLTQLLDKIDEQGKRIAELENHSHRQITVDDYWKRFNQMPTLPGLQWSGPLDLRPIC
jgi:hypothetical protein